MLVVLVLMLSKGTAISPEFYLLFSAFSYFSLVIVLMLGSWYGIWLGMYWYQKVYEEGSYKGFAGHIGSSLRQSSPVNNKIEVKLKTAKQTLEEGMKEFEELAEQWPPAIISEKTVKPVVVKKRVVRKRAVKKAL